MDTKQLFEAAGQGQIFQFWDTLSESEQVALLEQASEIDLQELDKLVATLVKGEGKGDEIDFSLLEPAPFTEIPVSVNEDEKWQEAKRVGEAALQAGKVAAFTVAGGQGTRLGYDGPKGTFPVTPVKGKTLFQVFAEKIQFARTKYDCALPWYIMTSQVNHEATVAYFAKHDNFGLTEGSVKFFKQGRMPAVDFDGKIILESKSQIAMSPDGHGGALRALKRSGALAEMQSAGIETISYFQVDNPLVQPIDPYFIGFHLVSGSTLSSKMLPKAYAKEKLGNFCILDGTTMIVEYSDMPDELCERRNEAGQLSFRAGSIAIHVIAVSLAQKLASGEGDLSLPFHRADKKIPFVDVGGNPHKPDTANGVKFEMFVFDAIPFADKPLVLETTRLGDFSPVKNAEGVDSPESCKADQNRLFKSWLEAAGVNVASDFSGDIEISPLYAVDSASFVSTWTTSPHTLDFGDSIVIE